MSRILIIEDEESIAELEKDYLELSDFEVQVENDGRKGLDKALAEEFDLIVLDLMLPGMDGFEICKRIREKSDVPILMVSARKDDIDKIRGLGLGADDYMTKPFSPSELVARVKSQMRRYTALGNIAENVSEEENVFHSGGLVIDDNKKEVTVDGEPIRLTRIEYNILLFLLQNKGKVFSIE